jgi:DNA polymerase III alpha subunit (gram-positive type)
MAQKISDAQRKGFADIVAKKYSDQAIWYLNGFWKDGAEAEAETVWKYAQKFIEIDEKRKKEGNELDEFQAHKFLESLGETLTVVAMRDRLRQIDLDFNRRVALIEYLTVRYGKNVDQILNAPQGDNGEKLVAAQAKFDAVQRAYEEVSRQLEEQQRSLSAQKQAEAESKKAAEESKRASDAANSAATESKKAADSLKKARDEANHSADVARQALEEQQKAEEIVRKAEEELRTAYDELKKQEDAYSKQVTDLETKSKDANASLVTRNKAANELAQLKQEDPLPLRRAKISQEAVLRKVEKERKAAESATANAANKAKDAEAKAHEADKKAQQAEHSAQEAAQRAREADAAAARAAEKAKEAEAKRVEVEEQTRRVEESLREAEAKLVEAQQFLEEVKAQPGVAHGAIWWLERELKEQQKYLPKSKQRQFN